MEYLVGFTPPHDEVCADMNEDQKWIMLGVPLLPAGLSFISSCFMVVYTLSVLTLLKIHNFLSFGKGTGFSKLVACLAWADHFWAMAVIIQCATPDLTSYFQVPFLFVHRCCHCNCTLYFSKRYVHTIRGAKNRN